VLCTPDGGAPYCADTSTDNANCGGCGAACPQGKSCMNGSCQVSTPCSLVALAWCTAKGWTVPTGGQAAGGRLYCTNAVATGNNCSACATYNMLVWKDGSVPLYCPGTYTTKAGSVYGGHSPCACGDNLLNCGTWDMQGCFPD
jgi:hypothetical protein